MTSRDRAEAPSAQPIDRGCGVGARRNRDALLDRGRHDLHVEVVGQRARDRVDVGKRIAGAELGRLGTIAERLRELGDAAMTVPGEQHAIDAVGLDELARGAESDVAEPDEEHAAHRKSGPSSSRHPPCERGTGLLPRKRATPPMIPGDAEHEHHAAEGLHGGGSVSTARDRARVGRDVAAVHGEQRVLLLVGQRVVGTDRRLGRARLGVDASQPGLGEQGLGREAERGGDRVSAPAPTVRAARARSGSDTGSTHARARRDRAATTSRVVAAIE